MRPARAAVFFDPADRYIWSLAVDQAGNVFAATGDKGVIYKITPDGKGAPFYADEGHARDDARLRPRRAPARRHRIARPRVPASTRRASRSSCSTRATTRSTRCASTADGNIYAAAVSGRGRRRRRRLRTAASAPAPAPLLTPSVSTEITVVAIGDRRRHRRHRARLRHPAPRSAGPAAGALFRILPDGAWDLLWESREDTPYDVAVRAPTARCSSPPATRARSIASPAIRTAHACRARQRAAGHALLHRVATAACSSRRRTRASCSGSSPARAERGTYTSDVRDAQTVAPWGTIKWQALTPAGSRVEISTRSGNTRTPDETWSDWSAGVHRSQTAARSPARARAICSGARAHRRHAATRRC